MLSLFSEPMPEGAVQPPQATRRSNSFTLTGNTQMTQIASMTGAACVTDWLMIPCASNLGKVVPAGGLMCIDRLCGGTFNADTQSLNRSSIVSEFVD